MKCDDCGNEVSKVYSKKLDTCTNCGQMIDIKTPKEPEKIQTEYEWKKERSILLRVSGDPEHGREYKEILRWLNDNTPEQWEICDKENTKVGDTVRYIHHKDIRIVEFFSRDGKSILLYNESANDSFRATTLDSFEININRQGK